MPCARYPSGDTREPGMRAKSNHFENLGYRLRLTKISSAPSRVLPWSVALALSAVVVGSTLAFIM
jgi:hypothetical protein